MTKSNIEIDILEKIFTFIGNIFLKVMNFFVFHPLLGIIVIFLSPIIIKLLLEICYKFKEYIYKRRYNKTLKTEFNNTKKNVQNENKYKPLYEEKYIPEHDNKNYYLENKNAIKNNINNTINETNDINNNKNKTTYKKVDLLTNYEKQLYEILKEYSENNNYKILSKIRLADLINSNTNIKKDFYNISSKHIDFAICYENNLEPILLIELDDSSHNKAERRERDDFINQSLVESGYKILHIRNIDNTLIEKITEIIEIKIPSVYYH